jgi:hypothetical protein
VFGKRWIRSWSAVSASSVLPLVAFDVVDLLVERNGLQIIGVRHVAVAGVKLDEAVRRVDRFRVPVAGIVAIGRHQDRATRPDRIGMLTFDFIELPPGLEPVLAVHLRPGVIINLLDRALDIDGRHVVVAGAADH